MAASRNTNHALLIATAVIALSATAAQAQQGALPMSRCVFRLPYFETTPTINVNPSNLIYMGHNGTDLTGGPPILYDPLDPATPPWPIGYPLVAMADGVVRWVEEDNTDCCRGCGGCNNRIYVEHASGDFSAYAHIAPNGAIAECGDTVVAGQIIALEGDTGASCGGNNSGGNNRPPTTCNGQGPAASCANWCGIHCHMSTFFGYDASTSYCADTNPSSAFEWQTIPVFCNIVGNIMLPGATYDSTEMGSCSSICIADFVIFSEVFDATAIDVRQAEYTITANAVEIHGPGGPLPGASVSFRAGDEIRLQPGFHAEPGCYFLGIISPCNGCPPERD